MIKRVLTGILAFTMMSTVLVGCGKSGEVNKSSATATTAPAATAATTPLAKTSINFVYTGGDPLWKQVAAEKVAAFTKKNPNVTVVEVPSPSGSYIDFLKVKDAVGEFPDLMESRDTAVWARAGKLAEIPSDLMALVENPPLLDGKAYTVPYSAANTAGMFYNVKMFKDNGLSEPKTYKEFLDLCDKLKSKNITPMVLGGKDLFHMGFWFGYYMVDNVFTQNPNWIADRYRNKVKFSDPLILTSLAKYADLAKKQYFDPGYFTTGDNQIASYLVTGKVAMFYSGTHMFKQIADADPKFEFSWFPLPSESGKLNLQAGSTLTGWSYSVNTDKDAAKKAAAQAWIKFFFEKDNYVDYLSKTSAFPVSKQKVEVKYVVPGMEKVLAAINKADYKDLNWSNKSGENELPAGYRDFAYKCLQEVMAGGYSMEEMGKKLDAEWDNKTKDFNPTVKK